MAIRIEYASTAKCRPEHIWQCLQDLQSWPKFDPEAIESAQWVSGTPWTKGARFQIRVRKPLAYTITPEILDAEEPILIHWRGRASGITGEQFYVFKLLPDEQTEMRTLQEYSGAPLLLLRGGAKTAIEQGVRNLFEKIKAEAEEAAKVDIWRPPPV